MDASEIAHLIGGPPRLRLADILRHPRLPRARKAYLDSLLEVYGDDPFLVRLLIESGRFAVYLVTTVLDAAHDPARRETWLTVGLLKQTMQRFGCASARHVDQLIARLCAVDYIESRVCEEDRRARILVPTEAFRTHDRDWLAANFAPLQVLYPQHGYDPIMNRDARFHAAFRRNGLPFLSLGARLFSAQRDMMLFMDHAGGLMVLASLLHDAMAQGDGSQVNVCYTEVGDRFGISRTHVRNLLMAAEAAGLLRMHGRGARCVEILPRLWASHDRAMACSMYGHDIVYQAATRSAASRPATHERDAVLPALRPIAPMVIPPPALLPAPTMQAA